jgi:hypothetical protein
VAALTLYQGVGEAFQVTAGRPHLGVHQDAGIQTNRIVTLLNHRSPPGLFNILLQFYAKRSVIPATGQASIDFAAGKDETASSAEGDNLFHINLFWCSFRHGITP